MATVGIDIENILRFSKLDYQNKLSFYEKIFTKSEIKYCLSKPDPYPHFTARFCAKEATIKASSNKKINFKDIEVIIENSKPVLKIRNERLGAVSLSHTDEYAIAIVLID